VVDYVSYPKLSDKKYKTLNLSPTVKKIHMV
jgi:hypothetical protein